MLLGFVKFHVKQVTDFTR